MEKTVYVGNALTSVPDEFLTDITELRRLLREREWRVLEYLGTKKGTSRDVWKRDMHDCVGGCDILLGVADYASTGLGVEIGIMIGRHEGPVLIVASEERVQMVDPRVVTRAVQDPDEKYVRFMTYHDISDVPDLLDYFCAQIEQEGYSFGPSAPPLEQFSDLATGQPLFRPRVVMEQASELQSDGQQIVGSWIECHCQCHDPLTGGLRADHMMPCCMQCPWCQLNIVGDMDSHVREVHPQCVGKEASLLPLPTAAVSPG